MLFYISNLSSGFFIWSKPLFVIWVYISVVLLLECPSRDCMYRKSVPFSNKCVANECLRLCIDTFLLIFAILKAVLKILYILLSAYCPPFSPSNSHSFGLYSLKYWRKINKVLLVICLEQVEIFLHLFNLKLNF